jgi:anti-sigma factor RsiW
LGKRLAPTAPALVGALALVFLVFLALGLTNGWPWAPHTDLLAQQVETAHVRSLMGSHLTDVTSTDQHTVKPWFDGKLDFSPPVVDLTAQGFPLSGRRLEYIDNRQAAALVYLHNKHVINLLIWPSTAANTGLSQTTINGYHLVSWIRSGMSYWAVSDLETAELLDFVKLFKLNSP